MTHIADPLKYETKKAFKEAVDKDPAAVRVYDPAIIGAVSGTVEYVSQLMVDQNRGSFTVTNHPKRSWFAEVARNKHGKVVVK